jgi:hypothetical protein
MYIKFEKGRNVKKGRCLGYSNYWADFILISLYFFHIRICPNKQVYDNLPQAG